MWIIPENTELDLYFLCGEIGECESILSIHSGNTATH
jgi:hypothetical protein